MLSQVELDFFFIISGHNYSVYKPGRELIKAFSFTTQLSMIFVMSCERSYQDTAFYVN